MNIVLKLKQKLITRNLFKNLTHCMPSLRHTRDAPHINFSNKWCTKSFSRVISYFCTYQVRYPANQVFYLLKDCHLRPLKIKRATDWSQKVLRIDNPMHCKFRDRTVVFTLRRRRTMVLCGVTEALRKHQLSGVRRSMIETSPCEILNSKM